MLNNNGSLISIKFNLHTYTPTAGSSLIKRNKKKNLLVMMVISCRIQLPSKKNTLGGAALETLEKKCVQPTGHCHPKVVRSVCTHRVIAANIILEDQIALLKAPLSGGKEIYSSCGRMCQISLVLALTTAKPTRSDVRAPESMTIILFSPCSGHKTMPSVHRKVNRGNRFHCQSLFCVVFVRQEG